MMSKDADTTAHRKRIERLKKMILCLTALCIIIPIVICMILGIELKKTRDELKETEDRYNVLITGDGSSDDDAYSTQNVTVSKRTTETYVEGLLETDESISEKNTRKVYITFDDGPSSNTDRILDILDEYNVKATFFVVGKDDPEYVDIYKRIIDDGCTLGMHSYSHKYSELYASETSFLTDLSKLQEFLYDKTGVWPRLYRFPGGSSNTVSDVDMKILTDDLDKQDIIYYDWNIASGDAKNPEPSASRIVSNCMSRVMSYKTAVILMHDASDKGNTVKALPKLIAELQKLDNTEILPITDDTKPVQHIKETSLSE